MQLNGLTDVEIVRIFKAIIASKISMFCTNIMPQTQVVSPVERIVLVPLLILPLTSEIIEELNYELPLRYEAKGTSLVQGACIREGIRPFPKLSL